MVVDIMGVDIVDLIRPNYGTPTIPFYSQPSLVPRLSPEDEWGAFYAQPIFGY